MNPKESSEISFSIKLNYSIIFPLFFFFFFLKKSLPVFLYMYIKNDNIIYSILSDWNQNELNIIEFDPNTRISGWTSFECEWTNEWTKFDLLKVKSFHF